MTPNEELRIIMATIPLKQERVAELLEPTSLDTVKGWCADPSSSRYRNMPPTMLRLLKFELRDRGLLKE